MTVEWKDPNMRLHGKRRKSDSYYFRWHYGKQRRVWISKEYVDRPTEKQVSAREAFTELRREVARQLRDAVLREAWERRFAEDNEGYKMLHTYVYAKMKASSDSPVRRERAQQEDTYHPCERCSPKGDAQKGVSTSGRMQRSHAMTSLLVWNGVIVPIFLPANVPKNRVCTDDKKALLLHTQNTVVT